MENKKFDSIKKYGKTKSAAFGADSQIIQVVNSKPKDNIDINVVAKRYENLSLKLKNSEKIEEILKQYSIDTERAKQIVDEDPNPLNQSISINNKNFSLNYQILSQGPLMLREKRPPGMEKFYEVVDETENLYSPTKEKEVQTILGQKFVGGSNLLYLMNEDVSDASAIKTQEIFLNNEELCDTLDTAIGKFFSYISKKLGVNFSYASMNVKPFLNHEEKKILLVITDLAGGLMETYLKIIIKD